MRMFEHAPVGKHANCKKWLHGWTDDSRCGCCMHAGQHMPDHARDYETLGYVISGKAELHVEGKHLQIAGLYALLSWRMNALDMRCYHLTTSDNLTVIFAGQVLILQPGDSWMVPRGAKHHYKILEALTAIECTSPPAVAKDRDHPPSGTDSATLKHSAHSK